MASRKEEKERIRQERLEAERQASAAARRRLLVGYIVAGGLGVAILTGLGIAIFSGGSSSTNGQADSANVDTRFGTLPSDLPVDDRSGTAPPPIENADLVGASRTANCDLQENLKDEGNAHFSDLNKVVQYGTNPPTSGNHYASPDPTAVGSGALADGAFTETPNWNRALHSLEHGRVEIQYSPDLPEEDQLALKGIFDSARPGVDLFPNAEMPYEVAATAWTQLLGCKTYDGAATLDAIRDFRDKYVGRGPESIPFQ